MQAVILAAGQGTRMRPLTETLPKPMLPVADRPLVAHTADGAIAAGATELIFVIGYQADAVRSYFGDRYQGVPITYAVQTEQAGTADAVAAASDQLSGPFVVLNGDNLYDTPALESLFAEAPALCAVTVDQPQHYGVLETDGGTVTGIIEKPDEPPTNLANAGAYAFPAAAKEWLVVPESERGEHEITDVVARTIEETDVSVVTCNRWLDVGRPWELLEANEWKLGDLSRRLAGDVSADATIHGNVVVEAGATVKSGVVIDGPALIRSGATVGPNAYIRGNTLVSEGASVGHAVEVKNSVLFPDATVNHLSYVGDSILGEGTNFGAGTTVANLRHDDQPVKMTVKGERVSTDRRKFGVVVGDGAKTGINTSLNAGVVLGTDARTKPGESVTRDREAGAE